MKKKSFIKRPFLHRIRNSRVIVKNIKITVFKLVYIKTNSKLYHKIEIFIENRPQSYTNLFEFKNAYENLNKFTEIKQR